MGQYKQTDCMANKQLKIHSKVNCYVGFDRQKKYKSLENRYEKKI